MSELPRRPLGTGGPDVMAVGYGGMHLSIADRPERAAAVRAVHAALDAGVTLIDTADVYCLDDSEIGHNERLISAALDVWSGPAAEIIVATKGGLTRPDGRWERDGRPEHLLAAAERSLKALAVDEITLYQLHAPDPKVPFEDSVGALARLRDQGKIIHVGLSNVSVHELDLAREIVPIASVQNRLNPFFREALQDGLVQACTERGVAFIAYSPTGGGRLNLTLPTHPETVRIAQRHDVTAHQVVLAWVRQQSPVVIPIPSARQPEHARQSAESVTLELTSDDLETLTEAHFPT